MGKYIESDIQIRFADSDSLGHINNVNLQHYFDVGKMEFYEKVLGKTIDDAAGEACDKFAKAAGLPYPGGALLDALGRKGKADPHLFPRPYTHNDNLDFSFSGLKTAGALWLSQHPDAHFPGGDTPARERLDLASQELCDAAASYLLAIAETLVIKAVRAMELFRPKSIVVAGGVAANSIIRADLQNACEKAGVKLYLPPLRWCGDNGAMIGAQAYYEYLAGNIADQTLNAYATRSMEGEAL